MVSIYFYDGPFGHGKAGYDIIKRAARLYCNEKGFDVNELNIEVDNKGKPFFVGESIYFSLSHTGDLWMCAFSEFPCGLDIQETGSRDIDRIAERMYTDNEKKYVQLWGSEGFYDVWVRKEALAKYTGEGIFSETVSVVSQTHDLMREIAIDDTELTLYDIELLPEIKCALCSPDKEGWEVRELI